MAVKVECVHHWQVEQRSVDEFCKARCKICGTESQFEAYPVELEKQIVISRPYDPLWGLVDSHGYLKLG